MEKQELMVKTQEELVDIILELQEKLSRKRGDGRKAEVLKMLQEGPMSIFDMAEALGITNKNVSSQLCYLKKDGYAIATNSKGEKFLED